jgi:hypothetical protein
MRRFLKRGLPVGLFLLVTLFYPLLAPTPHRIDQAHYEQIGVGMTLADVESRFGAPAGAYDWAVPENPTLWLWNTVNLTNVPITIGSSDIIDGGVIFSEVIVTRAPNDPIVWNLPSTNVSRIYTNADVVQVSLSQSRTWISRHGTCTIQFDGADRVIGKTGWGETRLEPPWHNWQKWFSK